MTQIGHDKRLFKAQASLGKSLIAAGQLESRGRLPLRIFDAIKECADYKRYALTYNDMRAVTTEIWLWVVATFGVSSIDIEFARHIEKQLVAKILSLPPGRRHGWAKIIMLRFENGNRSNAAVRHAPPSHNPFRARAHPRPRPSAGTPLNVTSGRMSTRTLLWRSTRPTSQRARRLGSLLSSRSKTCTSA